MKFSLLSAIFAVMFMTVGAHAADECRAPFPPAVPDAFETEEQLMAVYEEVKDFVQVKSPAYLECLDTLRQKVDPQADDSAAQMAAIDEKHNANVADQEEVSGKFNKAYKAWKAAHPE